MMKDFVNKLVEEKKLENVSPEVLEQVKLDLEERLDERINVMILDRMPSYKIEEFEKILDSKSEEEIQQFCQENIPGLEELVASELLDFRKTYLGL